MDLTLDDDKKAYVLSVISTKGGAGKTTLAANLGALLADLGWKVLLIDADVQPSLSRYFSITKRAPYGLTELVNKGGRIGPMFVSTTSRDNLDLVVSDVSSDIVKTWLEGRDTYFTMKRVAATPFVTDTYNVLIIDTQGAVGRLQESASIAADAMLSPINPTIMSAREFGEGTIAMLEDLSRNADMGHRPGILKALIYGTDRSRDCQLMADTIRQSFRNTHKVQVLNTVIPSCVAFRAAATNLIPAYEYELANRNKARPAYAALHELVWELFSNFRDIYYDEASPIAIGADDRGGQR